MVNYYVKLLFVYFLCGCNCFVVANVMKFVFLFTNIYKCSLYMLTTQVFFKTIAIQHYFGCEYLCNCFYKKSTFLKNKWNKLFGRNAIENMIECAHPVSISYVQLSKLRVKYDRMRAHPVSISYVQLSKLRVKYVRYYLLIVLSFSFFCI